MASSTSYESVDLQGQITNTTHETTSTTIDIAIRTRQQTPYPNNTTIVVACYDAKQYDIRQTKVVSANVHIYGISSTKAVYTSLTIPKTNQIQTILCHIDDTNIVPELNDHNQVGRVHVHAQQSN